LNTIRVVAPYLKETVINIHKAYKKNAETRSLIKVESTEKIPIDSYPEESV